jgi:hypothetical protein
MTSKNWKRTIGLALLVCSTGALTPAMKAQDDGTSSPPKVLYIVREMVKPGKGTAHEKWTARCSLAGLPRLRTCRNSTRRWARLPV